MMVRPSNEGVARRKAQTYGIRILGEDTAGASRRAMRGAFLRDTPGPAFSVGLNLPTVVSQLLAGLHSEPGGSSDAARVPCCDKTRRRRTPSRLTTPHDAPLKKDEVRTGYARFGPRGLFGDSSPRFRHRGNRWPVICTHSRFCFVPKRYIRGRHQIVWYWQRGKQGTT